MDSKAPRSNPKRRSTSPKRKVTELKHIVVKFEHPDDEEDSPIFGTFFCEYGTISKEEQNRGAPPAKRTVDPLSRKTWLIAVENIDGKNSLEYFVVKSGALRKSETNLLIEWCCTNGYNHFTNANERFEPKHAKLLGKFGYGVGERVFKNLNQLEFELVAAVLGISELKSELQTMEEGYAKKGEHMLIKIKDTHLI
jgi:hypothetical protein